MAQLVPSGQAPQRLWSYCRYVLSNIETKRGVRKGERVWQVTQCGLTHLGSLRRSLSDGALALWLTDSPLDQLAMPLTSISTLRHADWLWLRLQG